MARLCLVLFLHSNTIRLQSTPYLICGCMQTAIFNSAMYLLKPIACDVCVLHACKQVIWLAVNHLRAPVCGCSWSVFANYPAQPGNKLLCCSHIKCMYVHVRGSAAIYGKGDHLNMFISASSSITEANETL